jgi:hypothetical protein
MILIQNPIQKVIHQTDGATEQRPINGATFSRVYPAWFG